MKHIPILYQAEAVKAKRAGIKTNTRRLRGLELINEYPDEWEYKGITEDGYHIFKHKTASIPIQYIKCPYGQPGDVLWTREKFFSGYHLDENDQIQDDSELAYWYFADTRDARPGDISDEMCMHLWGNNKECWPRWKPGLHMPKSACRMWDEIVSIRAERVADISEEDAIAEGVKPMALDHLGNTFKTYKRGFESVITAINGPEIWDQNKWVWRIEFKPIDKPENWPV